MKRSDGEILTIIGQLATNEFKGRKWRRFGRVSSPEITEHFPIVVLKIPPRISSFPSRCRSTNPRVGLNLRTDKRNLCGEVE